MEKGELMGNIIFLPTQSPEPANAPQRPERLHESLTGIGAIANGIVAVEDKSAMMVRGIAALQKSLETLEGIYGAIADSADHEQFLRETKIINARLQAELTKLALILQRTQVAAEQVRHFDRSVR
jgi:CII-binding regulator of phage lambda lysogenization HflD